jgi:hypothetical protein
VQMLFDPEKNESFKTSSFLSSSLMLKEGITNAVLWMYSCVPVPSTVPNAHMGTHENNMDSKAADAVKSFSQDVMFKMNLEEREGALSIFQLQKDVSCVSKFRAERGKKRVSTQIAAVVAVDDFLGLQGQFSSSLDESNDVDNFLRVFAGLIAATQPSTASPTIENCLHELRTKLFMSVVNIFNEKAEEENAHGTGEEAKAPEHIAKARSSLLETCSSLQFSVLRFCAHMCFITQGSIFPPVSSIVRSSGFLTLIFGECPYFFKHPTSQARIDPSSLQCQYIRALRQAVVNFIIDMPTLEDSNYTELLLLRKEFIYFIEIKDVFSVHMILSAMHSIIDARPEVSGESLFKICFHLEVPKLLQQISVIIDEFAADASCQLESDSWESVFMLFCVVIGKSLQVYRIRFAMLLPLNLRVWLDLMYWPRLRFFASLQIREAIVFLLNSSDISKPVPLQHLKSALDVIFQNFTTFHDPQVGPSVPFKSFTQEHKGHFILGLLHMTYCLCSQRSQQRSAKKHLQELFIISDVFTHLSSLLHLPDDQQCGDEFLAASVVRCIGAIMHASVQGKKAFTLYGEFSKLLWSWCGNSSRAYMIKDALKYMALDPIRSNRITNGDVVKLMIDLSRQFTDEHAIMFQYKIIQETADDTLLKDDVRDVISASECCAAGLLSSLIEWLSAIAIQEETAMQSGSVGSPDMLQAYVIRVVKILGAHKIYVKDLKDWFRLLRPRQAVRPSLFKELLKNLNSMVESAAEIVSFFVFDGPDAGLFFHQQTDKVSLRTGIGSSLCFWLQFSVSDMDDFWMHKSPHVLTHVWNKKGEVLLVVFDEQHIKILYRDKSDRDWSVTSLKMTSKWTPDQWHFVCISFTPAQGGFMSRKPPQIDLFIGDNAVTSAPPANSKTFDFGSFDGVVANVLDQLVEDQLIDQQIADAPMVPRQNGFDEFKAFKGRIAGFSFMANALTVDAVAEYGHIASLLDASSKLSLYPCLLSINPRAIVVGSSDHSGSGQRKEYANVGFSPPDSQLSNATIVGKTIPVVSTSAKEMLECVGGVRAIFPLLEVIEQGDADASLAAMVIEFLVAVCTDCKLNVRSFVESKGFEILHLRLRNLRPDFKTPELYQSIKKLITTVYSETFIQQQQHDETFKQLLSIAKIVELPSERPDSAAKVKMDENRFNASLLLFDPRIWVNSSPKCFKMVFWHLIHESFDGFSLEQKIHCTPIALTLRLICRFLSASSLHPSYVQQRIEPISIEYLKHIAHPNSVEFDEFFTPETINEFRHHVIARVVEKYSRKSGGTVHLLQTDWRLMMAFIVSTEEPMLLNDLVSLFCNVAIQLHARNVEVLFDILRSPPLAFDQIVGLSSKGSSRKADHDESSKQTSGAAKIVQMDLIEVLIMQICRVNENCRGLIAQLLSIWLKQLDGHMHQKFPNLKRNRICSMIFAAMSRLESGPPILNDVVVLICGATNAFASIKAKSAPARASETPLEKKDSFRSSKSAHEGFRRSGTVSAFNIQDMDASMIPRMLKFNADPTLSCDLQSTFHLFQPVLLLLRFLPNKDFATVAEILKQVFSSISLETKITVLRETLHIRSGDGSRSSGSEGNLLIWLTKAILSARCSPGCQDEHIDKLREILCKLFLIAIEDCPMGHKFLEECMYIIHSDIAAPSAIRENEAHRLIMWLFYQVRTKVAMKAAEHESNFESAPGLLVEVDFVKNLSKLLEFLGNFFFHLSAALSPDTYDK